MLVIGTSLDPHVDAVTERLRARAASCLRLDIDRFPREQNVTVYPSQRPPEIHVEGSALGEFNVAWFRRMGPCGIPDQVPPHLREFALAESGALVDSIEWLAPKLSWLNRPSAAQKASNKLRQLDVARRVGLRVPATLATNDPAEARSFLAKQPAVYKTLSAPVLPVGDGKSKASVYTSPVDPQALEHLNLLRASPVLLQERIEKAFELRLTYVRGQMFTARIDSQAVEEARVDWRAGMDGLSYDSIPTPPDLVRKVSRLMENLELGFGALDLAVTQADDTVFFEVNPHGAWLWIEDATGLPISASIVDSLVSTEPDSRVST